MGGGDARGLGCIQPAAGVPPTADDEATLHLPDRKPREARGKGGRQMAVSSPHSGWSFRTWMEVG